MRACVVVSLGLFACGTSTTDLVASPANSAGPPAACAPAGAACSADPECCPGLMPALRCMPDGPGSLTQHCESAPPKPCRAMGETCAPADCCGAGMTCSVLDGGAKCAPAM